MKKASLVVLAFVLIISSCSKSTDNTIKQSNTSCNLSIYSSTSLKEYSRLNYNYDNKGLLLSIDGVSNSPHYDINGKATFTYSQNQIIFKYFNSLTGIDEIRFSLDNVGKAISARYFIGKDEINTIEFSYNSDGFVKEARTYRVSPKTLETVTQYEYANGNLIKETVQDQNFKPITTTIFDYDLTKKSISFFDFILNSLIFYRGGGAIEDAIVQPILILPNNIFGNVSKNTLNSYYYLNNANLKVNFNNKYDNNDNPITISDFDYEDKIELTYNCK
jgi:hypothetical protein